MARTAAAAAIVVFSTALLGAAPPAPLSDDGGEAASSDAVLYRIFLKDGGVLVSYGEFANVADKVVLWLAIGGTHRPTCQSAPSVRSPSPSGSSPGST